MIPDVYKYISYYVYIFIDAKNIFYGFQLMTDNSYIYAIQTAAKNHAVTSTEPVYLYRFSVDAGYNLLKKSFEIIAGQMRPGKKAILQIYKFRDKQ